MAEYIERKALRDVLYDEDAVTMRGVAIINNFPAADVTPVVHGRWVDDEPDLTHGCYRHSAHYQCSVCGRRTGRNQTRNYKFCPKCGAKMDGEFCSYGERKE